VENSLAGLIELVPDLTDELLNHIDQPLKISKDPTQNKHYIQCDYNRDGDSYRSPWSNKYFPDMPDGFVPSARLRKMEEEANKIFDVYRKLYFEGGISSAYFFETDSKDDESFGSCFLIHKDVEPSKTLDKGFWDSIHVFEVVKDGKTKNYSYKLTTTVMVSMGLHSANAGTIDLSGSMTQQDTKKLAVDGATKTHMANMGKMLEDIELRIRNAIEGIYIQKTREVINGMRSASAGKEKAFGNVVGDLRSAIGKQAAKRVKDSE